MQEELKELVLRYTNKYCYANEQFIKEAIEIIINHLDIDNYLNKYCVLFHSNKTTIAQYYYDDNTMIFYFDAFNIYAEKYTKYCTNIYENILIYNLLVINTILHESEHANHIKLVNELSNWKTTVILASIHSNFIFSNPYFRDCAQKYNVNEKVIKNYYLDKDQKYNDNYNLAPEEKEANVFATLITNSIFYDIQDYHETVIYNLFKSMQLSAQKAGYDFSNKLIDSSTINYFKQVKSEFALPLQQWYDENIILAYAKCNNYSLDERSTFGLPITIAEYETLCDEYTLAKKKMQNSPSHYYKS